MIPQRNLSLLSNELARKGGRRIPEGLKKVFHKIEQQSGIKFNFSRPDRHTHQNSHTFFLGYEGPLPAIAPKEVKVDITIRERVVFSPQEKPVLVEYAQYEDIPKNSKVRVYSLDEIAAEKVVALSDRARNEPRDLYDLWHLALNQYVDTAELFDAVGEKLTFRGRSSSAVGEEFSRKEARLKKLWSERLSAQIAILPEFDQVYRTVKRELRKGGLRAAHPLLKRRRGL